VLSRRGLWRHWGGHGGLAGLALLFAVLNVWF
jgi:hypothetical protein